MNDYMLKWTVQKASKMTRNWTLEVKTGRSFELELGVLEARPSTLRTVYFHPLGPGEIGNCDLNTQFLVENAKNPFVSDKRW